MSPSANKEMPSPNRATDNAGGKSIVDGGATEKKKKKTKNSEAIQQNETNGSKATKPKEKPKAKSKKKKKNKKSKDNIPKPGEPGYLSPTQLRNARKRRAKQNKKRERELESAGQDGTSITGTSGESSPSNKKAKRSQASGGGGHTGGGDPSLKFLRNPQGAPVVQAARKFFANKLATTDDKFKVYMGPTTGWRTVAKLATRPDPASDSIDQKRTKMIIGLFEPKSHAIVPVPNCSAHHPSINAAVACLTEMCNRIGIAAFDEKTGEGYLRYLAMSVERKTGKVQLTLVWNSCPYHSVDGEDGNEDTSSDGKKMLNRLISEIRRTTQFDGAQKQSEPKKKRRRGKKGREETIGNGESSKGDVTTDMTENITPPAPFELHSLFVHYNNQWKHSNAIFDISSPTESSWRHVCGPAYVEEMLDLGSTAGEAEDVPPKHPVALRFPPNVFRQANLDAFGGIVSAIRRRVSKYVEENSSSNVENGSDDEKLPSCLELYGGVGTIGLNLIDLVSTLTSSDENPNNVACFRGSVDDSSWPDEVKSRACYVGKNATKMIGDHHLSKSDILVVDPPRKGLEEPVLMALTDKRTNQLPRLVVYVSCGFDAFQRDCNAMLESGRWTLEHAEGHLLFPGSDAIETLAFFVRKD